MQEQICTVFGGHWIMQNLRIKFWKICVPQTNWSR